MSFRFVPTQRVIAKILKKLKNPIMASLQAKIGWKRRRKRENKNCLPFRSYPTGNIKFQKKRKKKKNTNLASLHAKIGWKMSRQRKNKNCLSVPFRSDW